MTPRNRRFERQIALFQRRLPFVGNTLGAISLPGRMWMRLPIAFALIAGGVLGFLPILGFWMLPLGALLLAVDLKPLRPIVGSLIVRTRAILRRWRLRF